MKPVFIHAPSLPQAQKGASLFIALVALVALTFTGLAMVRSSDTSALIAGNFAFRQTAINAGDLAIEMAIARLESSFGYNDSSTKLDTDTTWSSTNPIYYYAFSPDVGKIENASTASTNSTWDWPNGKSRRINWSNGTPANLSAISNTTVTANGNTPTTSVATNLSGFTYVAVIERLCQNDGNNHIHLTGSSGNVNLNCQTVAMNGGDLGQSRDPLFASSVVYVSYRITARIFGPRNTAATVQALIAKQQPPG